MTIMQLQGDTYLSDEEQGIPLWALLHFGLA